MGENGHRRPYSGIAGLGRWITRPRLFITLSGLLWRSNIGAFLSF